MELSKLWVTHRKWVLAAAGCLALVLSILSIFILTSQPKQITLTTDGTTSAYETTADTVGEFLSEQNIVLAEKDLLIPSADTPLTDSLNIFLHTSWEVPVVADGKTKVIRTLSRDVAGILQEAGITLSPKDKVTPALDSSITKGASVQVARIDERIVKIPEEVPFQEIRKNDSSLAKGEIRVLQQGTQGKVINHFKLVSENGKEVSRELIKRDVITPKRDRIIAVGTKAVTGVSAKAPSKHAVTAAGLVSRGGKVFRPQRILNDVTLTAYTPAGGGKSPKSPGYGRTATGQKAAEGRTIAVDPKVIPLGWWVYIEGIGYRRAEDTGGAVRGNKIDVFFDSHSQAISFGRKRGKKVYIIGPKLP